MRPPRRRWGDEGFTLIELMVVVLIIAVLLAIAIPSFFGARKRANDRAAQANVRNAFVDARIFYNGSQAYTADPTAMAQVDPAITWTNVLPDGTEPPNSVYIEVQDVPAANQTVVVAGRSKSGKCYFLRDTMAGSGTGTHFNDQVSANTACTIPPANDPGWTGAWTL